MSLTPENASPTPKRTPTVSAVIAAYNRAPELRTAINRLLTQTLAPMEILVVDDGSTDGTDQMMRTEFGPDRFPQIRYIRQPHNAGLILARNLGFVNTTGDYIVSVDDDSWFEENDGLARCVEFLEANPDVAIATCNIETPDGMIYYPRNKEPFEVPWYAGGGHVLRRSAVDRIGLYIPEFYRQGEEKDRCLRLMGAGMRIIALPHIMIYHDKCMKGRKPGLERFYNHRNDLIRELARCPVGMMPRRLLRVWAGNSWKNLRQGPRTTDLKILMALPEIIRLGRKYRKPLPPEIYRRWLDLVAAAAPATKPPPRTASTPVTAAGPTAVRQD